MTLFFIMFTIVVIFILASCNADDENSIAPDLLVPIITQVRFDTAIVTRGNVSEIEQHTGVVRVESQPLSFGSVSAPFDSFYVTFGESVSSGQLLASLNMEQLEIQIEQHEERIAEMRRSFDFENELRRIDIQLDRLTSSASSNSLELELAIERQTLQLQHAEMDLEALQARLGLSRLYAPFDGTIVYMSQYTYGSWVPSFSPVLYISPNDASIYVEYTDNVPLRNRVGAIIKAHIEGNVYSATRMRLTREQMTRYSNTPTRFSLMSETGIYPPVGAFVSLEIHINSVENVLRLPRNAIFFDPEISFYVHQIVDGQLETVAITVGVRTGTYFEIQSGVEEGDEVYVRS